MRLAIATHAGFYLCRLNAELQIEALKRVYEGYFYGLDQHPGGWIVAGERAEPWAAKKNSPTILHKLGPGGQPINSARAESIVDVHQITADQDRLLICDTGHDRLLRSGEPFWTASDTGEDNHHLNSVSVAGGEIFVALHNLGQRESEVVVLDRESGDERDRISLPHESIHNVEPLRNGHFVYNASQDGRVVEIDRSGKVVGLWIVGRHPKGMAVTDDLIIVGCSELAVRTKRRFVCDSEIVFISRPHGQVVERISLRDGNDPIGNLNELRIIED